MISPKFGDENSKNVLKPPPTTKMNVTPPCLFHSTLVPPILAAAFLHITWVWGTFLHNWFIRDLWKFLWFLLATFKGVTTVTLGTSQNSCEKTTCFYPFSCHPFVRSRKSICTPLKTNILEVGRWNSFWNRSMLMFHEFSWVWVSTQLEKIWVNLDHFPKVRGEHFKNVWKQTPNQAV